VIVLTRSSAIGYLNAVVVAPVSTTIRGIPSEVVVDAPDGVTQRSVISLDNLQTVAKHKLGPYISHLSGAKMREIRAALEFSLDLDGMR